MIDFESLLFNIDISSSRVPQPGAILVAEPFLREQYFNHSVICLVDYEPRGAAMGIVLNQPTAYDLAELISGIHTDRRIPVYCGGPMSCDRLYFIHTLGSYISGGRQIADGLWIGGDFDEMTEYVNSDLPIDGHIRFFVGYSGWSAGQLDGELLDNVWAVGLPESPSRLLTGAEDAYWHRCVKTLGEPYRGWLYHPRNPQSN